MHTSQPVRSGSEHPNLILVMGHKYLVFLNSRKAIMTRQKQLQAEAQEDIEEYRKQLKAAEKALEQNKYDKARLVLAQIEQGLQATIFSVAELEG